MSNLSDDATPGFLVWRLSMKWRVAVDRAVAPLGLTHAQYSLVASLHGMQRAGLRPSQMPSQPVRPSTRITEFTLLPKIVATAMARMM